MEDTKRPIFGAEAERIGTRLDEATDEFLKDGPGAGADAGAVEPARGGWQRGGHGGGEGIASNKRGEIDG